MIKVLSKIEEGIKRKLPQRSIMLLPGEYFFTQLIELPEVIESKDIEQFAEFSLESISPFPLEHLYWGFLYDEESHHILTYAAYRERLRKNGFVNLDAHEHVFPDFVAGLQNPPDREQISLICHQRTLNALFLTKGSRIPVKVRSIAIPEVGMDDESLPKHRDSFLKSLDKSGFEISEGLRILSLADGKAGAKPKLYYREANEPESVLQRRESFPDLTETGCWQADVRDKEFLRKERKALANSKKVWGGAMGAGIAAGLLLLLQLGIVAGGIWIKNREQTIESQSVEFNYVDERLNFLEKIDQIVQQELKPFEMLELTNVGRPKIIHFTEAAANSYNQILIEGIGSNVEAVNTYTQTLRNSPRVATVDTRVRSSGGKAPFTLQITFNEEPIKAGQVVAGVENNQ